jgi:hypothetical protein
MGTTAAAIVSRVLTIACAGGISMLNTLAAQHQAVAIIHSGDFGFYGSSLPVPMALSQS